MRVIKTNGIRQLVLTCPRAVLMGLACVVIRRKGSLTTSERRLSLQLVTAEFDVGDWI